MEGNGGDIHGVSIETGQLPVCILQYVDYGDGGGGGTNRGRGSTSDFVNVHFLVDCRSQQTLAKNRNVNETLHRKKRAELLRRDSETIYLLRTSTSMTRSAQ